MEDLRRERLVEVFIVLVIHKSRSNDVSED